MWLREYLANEIGWVSKRILLQRFEMLSSLEIGRRKKRKVRPNRRKGKKNKKNKKD